MVDRSRPGHYNATLLEKRDLSERYFLMILSRPPDLADPGPGSFIHLLVPGEKRFFLRRPFSVLDCDESTLTLIIVEKGAGTRIMRRLPVGENLDFIGPLGSSFPELPGKRVLAVGGGVGLAPLYYYHRLMSATRDTDLYRLLYGARTRTDLFIGNFDWSIENVDFSTDDGTYGFSGNVVQLAEREIERSQVDVIFSCGPTPMLKSVAALARTKRITHHVSLENRMACGMGACRSCVVPVRIDSTACHRTVCKDGPVFNADDLVWEELPEI
ncbi:MAG: dihydroorotate dehydrogenase electron transfer subunit [Candidatus Latescibacterota bacterium]|nr:MAG: dihydroorotate dehydrogenase electron transfer subunit [Candidatus Latescibacterota bacterium]